MAIFFSYADKQPQLKGKRFLKKFISNLFNDEDKKLEMLTYVFCSDEYLLNINKEFLKHDFYTDIITFDLGDHLDDSITGEIYISVDRVKENSLHHSTSFDEELLRVMFHGALHLCGFKDKMKREILIMRQKEDHYLRLYKIQNQ